MTARYGYLRKLTREPARRLLASANARLSTPVAAPAAAPVEVVLAELDRKQAHVDILRLLSVALPLRECIWWGCLAAEDMLQGRDMPPPLAAAQAWVFRPTEANREAARRAIETADPDDDTTLCAIAVTMHDGKLGGGELARFDAPAGGGAAAVFGMTLKSLASAPAEALAEHRDRLIARGLDIARGGDGRLGDCDDGKLEGAAP